jgi:hypothetical protein
MFLTACGGGSRGSMFPPTFTSTPPASATQDVLYNYTISATDPAGGPVSLSLASAPTGAALNSGTLSWTPTASQSRVPNSFTVTATTNSGGTASQNWMVSPNGTITLNWVDTEWTENGPVQSPIFGLIAPFALIPQSDGSLLTVQGSFISPGVVNILNVPAGYFWLARGPTQSNGIWTSSSTIDIGRDLLGTPLAGPASQNTIFDFNLSGLASIASSGWLGAFTDTFQPFGVFQVPANTTMLTPSVTFLEGPDWSKVDSAFLLQYEPVSLGSGLSSFNELALGPEVTLTGLTLTGGTTNTINGTLQATPPVSMNISVPGSQWIAPLGAVGPTPATLLGSWLSVVAEPYITGRVATSSPFGPELSMVTPETLSVFPPLDLQSDWCLNASFLPFGFLPDTEAPVDIDTNFGTLQYGDPFPSTWTRAVAFCQQANSLITIPNAPLPIPYPLLFGEAVPPTASLAPLGPLAGPVQNPMINGASMFTAATLNHTAVPLSWSAPAGTAPAGYLVVPVLITVDSSGGVALSPVGSFRTAKTSVTLPPLVAGQMYLFVITTLVDGAANVETNPYRSALPIAFAEVVSAPITISASAQTPVVHGDAKGVKQLMQPRPKVMPR